MDKGFALRGGTGGAFRSRHSSLTWRRKEHSGLATDGQRHGASSTPQGNRTSQTGTAGVRAGERRPGHTEAARDKTDAFPILAGTD